MKGKRRHVQTSTDGWSDLEVDSLIQWMITHSPVMQSVVKSGSITKKLRKVADWIMFFQVFHGWGTKITGFTRSQTSSQC